MTEAPWPVEIRVRKSARTVEIDYDTGETGVISAAWLRANSPASNAKTGLRLDETGAPDLNSPVAAIDAKPVGNYAVKFIFDDGHDTGLYTWARLRELADSQPKS